MKQEDGRKIPRDTLEYLRKQAIRLWKKKKHVSVIADFCGVTVDAVYKWIRKYKTSGQKSLKRKYAKGAAPKLSVDRIKKLLRILKKPATDFGFPTPLWDRKRIRKIILDFFGKHLHETNIGRLLRRCGLSPQVPEKEALEKNMQKVRKWMSEEWPKIKAHCRRWQAMLYFLDEAGVSLIPVVGRTWAPIGKTPKVRVTGKKGGIVVTAAMSTAGRLAFRIEKSTIHAKEHVDFLRQLMRHHPLRKIIVIEDNAKPHIAAEVKNFVEQHKRKIAVYYLPTYSPDLNPQEDVWRYLKHVKLKAHQAMSKEELVPLVRNSLIAMRQKKGLVRSFFYENILYQLSH